MSQLDLYIAGAGLPSDHLRPYLLQLGVDASVAREVYARVEDARSEDFRLVTTQWLTASFGEPLRRSESVWEYELNLWPHHYFVFTVREWGSPDGGLFRLRADHERPVAPSPRISPGALRPWYHTLPCVLASLGEPHHQTGWHPEEYLYYTRSGATGYIELSFFFDLFTGVNRPGFSGELGS